MKELFVDVTLWILTGVLGAAFLAGGLTLIVMGKERYRLLGSSHHWVDDFGSGQLRVIGAIKIVGALGLVMPGALDVATVLAPLAACGLMLFTAGAGTTRFRRGEWGFLAGDLVLLSAFAFLAWGRFDLEPF